jgi:hypothetical protein
MDSEMQQLKWAESAAWIVYNNQRRRILIFVLLKIAKFTMHAGSRAYSQHALYATQTVVMLLSRSRNTDTETFYCEIATSVRFFNNSGFQECTLISTCLHTCEKHGLRALQSWMSSQSYMHSWDSSSEQLFVPLEMLLEPHIHLVTMQKYQSVVDGLLHRHALPHRTCVACTEAQVSLHVKTPSIFSIFFPLAAFRVRS